MFVRNTQTQRFPKQQLVVMPSCLSEELRDDERVVKAAVAQSGLPERVGDIFCAWWCPSKMALKSTKSPLKSIDIH